MLKTKTHLLKLAREQRNLTQQQLADLTALGIATIQRAETGKRLRPDVRQRLCDFFEMTPLELGLLSDEEEANGEEGMWGDDEQVAKMAESGSDAVDRRNFLQTMGAAGVALFTPSVANLEPWERFSRALKHPSTIDQTTLTHLETLAKSSWQLIPDVTGVVSEELRTYTVNHLLNVTELLNSPLADTSRKRLASVGGEFSLIAASMSANLRDFDRAQAYYKVSIDAAKEAHNDPLEAVGLASLAIRLTHLHQPQKALPLVQEARRITANSGTLTTRAWLAAVEAEVQANLKNYIACFRALDDAENVPSEEVLPDEDPYMTTFSPSLLAGYKGVCHIQFGDAESAYKVLRDSLAYLNTPSISRRCYILTDLAEACIKRNEIVEACAYASQALILTAQAKSPALWQRIDKVSQQLNTWKDSQPVKDFKEQLRLLSGTAS